MRPRDTRDITRRPDGVIDTARYMRMARQRRSEQAHAMARVISSRYSLPPMLLRWLHPFRT